MKSAFIILSILALSLGDVVCTSNQVYMRFRKLSKSYASEESWTISNGATVLYTSPVLADNELREVETCVTATTNNQYTLQLIDTYGDSWSNGSYLEVLGINGNIAFKGFLIAGTQETYTLSLYEAVKKDDQWKFMSNSVATNWYETTFSDASWATETLGSVTSSTSGAQFFRKQINGLSGMAAYELSLYYRYGVIAYLNGVEIFRDNIPEGAVTSSTYANGGYSQFEYRSVIRPGSELQGSAVLAVGIFWIPELAITTVDFNAFLAMYASSNIGSTCYTYAYEPTITMTGTTSINSAWNWNKGDYYYHSSAVSSNNALINIAFDVNRASYINGIRFFPGTSPSSVPTGYTLSGSMTLSGDYEPIVVSSSDSYTSNTWKIKTTMFRGRVARYLQLSVTATNGGYLQIYEMQPVVCNIPPVTSIAFPQQSYSFQAIYEEITIKPTSDEFTNCQINPQPTNGLVFNTATCTLYGRATSASTTSFTVSSIVGTQTYSGTFSLTTTICNGSLLSVRRITKTNSYAEAYSIKDITTGEILIQQTLNGNQVDNRDVTEVFCVTGTNYRLTMEAALNYWYPYSFVVLGLILSDTQSESIGLFSTDSILGTPSVFDFRTSFEIGPVSTWYYKMSTVPQNWYDSNTSGWSEGTTNYFEPPTNQIQLYKKTFTVSSIEGSAALGVNIRYTYGVIVYINSVEIYRMGVTGDLTTNTFATNTYSSTIFRNIYLPVVTFGLDNQPSRNVVSVGQNTIAIALVARTADQTAANFDCTVRLTGEPHSNRVSGTSTTGYFVDYTTSITDSFIGIHTGQVYGETCRNNNDITMMYLNDRREWISSILLQNYYAKMEPSVSTIVIEAKNPEDGSFTVLKEVSGLKWSYAGQTKRIWLNNNKAYNIYRFRGMNSDEPNCAWKLNRIGVYADTITEAAPVLSYTPSTVTIYKNVEMAELYANSDLFKDFTVSPDLPEGLVIDAATGVISGTAKNEMTSQTYTVSAKKYNTGEAVTTQISIEVTVCSGTKSLITMTVQTDNNPDKGAYKLYQGKGTTGTVVSQIDAFPHANSYYYADFCLNHGIYTMQAIANSADGWTVPGGFMFTVDIGTLRFEVGQIPAGTSPVSVTSMFSSYLPFQIEYDDWKIYKDTVTIPTNWNAVDFNDASWEVLKAANFGTSEAVTVYVRRDINLDDVANYQVLNVRMRYAGGVVAYFNGRKVARFNLDEIYNFETESIEVHDSTVFSKFHIVLSTVGAVTGKNVIAFEIHRPKEQSSAEPIVFDATGVFGVNDCSIVVDDYVSLTSSTTTGSSIQEMFELAPYYSGSLPSAQGSYIEWVVENLEGSKFNSFGMHVPQDSNGYSFSLYGYPELEGEERTSILAEVDKNLVARQRNAFSVPAGIAGFRRFRFENDMAPSSPVYVSTYFTQYCKASGTGGCPAIDDYPAVGEGQISPSVCPDGFRGYSYRTCTEGKLGDIVTDQCVYKVPAFMRYPQDRYYFVKDAENESEAPQYLNVITNFYLDEGVTLPEGLVLDSTTGKIKGKPTAETHLLSFTVFGSNPAGVVSAKISIIVKVGECKDDGVWKASTVGTTLTYDCSERGAFIGSQTRECRLGTHDAEWQEVKGTCVSLYLIILLVIVVIVIIVVLVIVLKKKSGKSVAKAGTKKGAVKGKTMKKETKKDSKKDVKKDSKSVAV